MAAEQLAGSRIRERRLDRGLRQAALAETVGISPSYLNLIEHNRRRIGGKLLADIARVLGVEPALLTDGADAELLDQMRAASGLMGAKVEVARAEELAARYPGWAALIAAQSQRIAGLQDQVQALRDRMAHDPELAGALHEVITAVSAIRSSAAILVGPEELDADWQRRFHQNIHSDSLRLAASSEALVSYLEAPEAESDESAAPLEQAEAWLARVGFHVAALEESRDTPDGIAAKSGLVSAARSVLQAHLIQYAADAAALPLASFAKTARAAAYDPAEIAQRAGVRFEVVLRRLASLPSDAGHPPVGLAKADASGALTLLKPVPGFALPRFGGACPLWPVFAAFGRPEQPLRFDVVLPDVDSTRLRCFAVANAHAQPRFDTPPVVSATMLVLPDPPDDGRDPLPVGVSCRICPRTACASRREPALSGVIPVT